MRDERAAEGLDHLQAAALEMIEAARAFLDVVEEVVADRDKVAEVMAAVGSVAEAATKAARRTAGAANPRGPADDDGPVQHIRVS